jgi:ribosomal-protein-alanine N-acetyltransferase
VRQLVEPQKQPLRIRKLTSSDLDAVMEIQRASFKNPWSRELFNREMSHEWSTILLAEQPLEAGGVALVGFMIFWLVHDELHILNVATAHEARRQGVARTLLEAALASGRQNRCALATLEVRRSNEAALALYRSFNFRPVGIRPNYYVEEHEDAVVMVLDL